MVQPYTERLLATDYAKREGITKERVYQMIHEGSLDSDRVREGGRERVYVYPKPKIIEVPRQAAAGAVTLPALLEASQDIQTFLAALAARDRELIAPWERRVEALEKQSASDHEEIGDLKRQVRELKQTLAARHRVDDDEKRRQAAEE